MKSGSKTQNQKFGKDKKAVLLLSVFVVSFPFFIVHYHSYYFELSDYPVCKAKFALGSVIYCEPIFEFFPIFHCEKLLQYAFTVTTITSVSISNRAPPVMFLWYPTFDIQGRF